MSLSDYKALSATTPREQVATVIQAIVDAPLLTFDPASRTELVQLLLDDLKPQAKGRLTPKDVALAVLALKTLGKVPTGTRALAAPANLSILLSVAGNKDDTEAANEALRCIANALLLHEAARSEIITKEVGGGEQCAVMLDVCSMSSLSSISLTFFPPESDQSRSDIHPCPYLVSCYS